MFPIISGIWNVVLFGEFEGLVTVVARDSHCGDTDFASSLYVHVCNKSVTESHNLWIRHMFTRGKEVTVFHAVEISDSVMSCVSTIE